MIYYRIELEDFVIGIGKDQHIKVNDLFKKNYNFYRQIKPLYNS